MLWYLAIYAACIWVIFFGGADRLENIAAGYFEFGPFAERASYIKACAWLTLLLLTGVLLHGLF